jgi:hypothetical protein
MNLLTNFLIITIFYFIVIGIQRKLYKNKEEKLKQKFEKINKKINFNLENSVEIENIISTELNKRVDMLQSMNYQDWINYNQKNLSISFQHQVFHIQVWKKVPNYDNFILKCDLYPEYINNDRADFAKRVDSHRIYKHKYAKDEDFLHNFYNLNEKPYTKISHFWIAGEFQPQLRKNSVGVKYDDGKGNTGIIMAGYNIENISQKYYTQYFKFTKKIIYTISLITFIVALILCFINKENKYSFIKGILLILIINIYLTIFILSGEDERTIEAETQKENNINSGILEISFLVGVNIFIIGKIERDKIKKSFILESSFMFVLVLITLLISTIKMTNYSILRELSIKRLEKELFFNVSILLNIYIIINFGLYMFFGVSSKNNTLV